MGRTRGRGPGCGGGVAHALSFPHPVIARPQGRRRSPSHADGWIGANSNADKQLATFVVEGASRDAPVAANPQPLVTGTTFEGEVVPAVLHGEHQDRIALVRQGGAPHSPPDKAAGVLERVKGTLAPLGGCAALDPPSALPVLALTGNAAEQTAQGKMPDASRAGAFQIPESRRLTGRGEGVVRRFRPGESDACTAASRRRTPASRRPTRTHLPTRTWWCSRARWRCPAPTSGTAR